MKSFANNNTTYNYSYYATRPKWLVGAYYPYKRVALLSKKLNRNNPVDLIVPFTRIRKNPKKKLSLFNPLQKRLKPSKTTPKTSHERLSLLAKTSNKAHRSAYQKHIKDHPLFETKELLCWTSDLSFFNLRGYFSNILKALQICRFAARNNKKILFIKGSHFTYAHSKQLNSWLVQYHRQVVPQKLRGVLKGSDLKIGHCALSVKNQSKRKLVNSSSKNLVAKGPKRGQTQEGAKTFAKSTFLTEKIKKKLHDNNHSSAPKETESLNFQRFYRLSSLLSSSFILAKKKIKEANEKQDADPSTSYSEDLNDRTLDSSLSVNAGQKKKTKIKTNDYIKIRVKEAQVTCEQTAAGLTVPLAGFLTNSKTTFKTLYNLSNYDFYNYVISNRFSNLDENLSEVQTNNILEEIIRFPSSSLYSSPQESKVLNPINLPTKRPQVKANGQKVKSKERQMGCFSEGNQQLGEGIEKQKRQDYKKGSSINKLYKKSYAAPTHLPTPSLTLQTLGLQKKEQSFVGPKVNKQGGQKPSPSPSPSEKKIPSLGRARVSKNEKKAQSFFLNHPNTPYYLPFTSNINGDLSLNDQSETTKKQKLLEYGFFGDVLTWQLKSQNAFNHPGPFSSKKKNTESLLWE